MLAFLNQVRKPTLDLPLEVRRKMWFKPFMQSYLVVFIGYLTMYLIRKNFNIAQNDMISTYGLSMTQLGMIGLGFSITYGVGKTLVSYYADGKNTKQFLPFMLILSAICMLGFSASMGSGSVSLFLMIAFYALSGFFQSTGGSCSYSTITKWTPRRKRGTFLGFWNISHNLGGAGAAGVALFGANYLFDGHVIGMFIFPSIIALIVGFIGLRYGSDSPESYGLGKAEELFGEEISEEDKETESTDMTKWQIFVEYVLKNKVIWLLCFANIFLYVVRIGITSGIGLFIALMGLKNTGVIVANKDTLVMIGDLSSHGVLLGILGFFIITVLSSRHFHAAVLVSIVVTSCCGLFFGDVHFSGVYSIPPDISGVIGEVDLSGALTLELAGIIFSFMLINLFDSSGTLIGVTDKAGLIDSNGKFPNMNKALYVDSVVRWRARLSAPRLLPPILKVLLVWQSVVARG